MSGEAVDLEVTALELEFHKPISVDSRVRAAERAVEYIDSNGSSRHISADYCRGLMGLAKVSLGRIEAKQSTTGLNVVDTQSERRRLQLVRKKLFPTSHEELDIQDHKRDHRPQGDSSKSKF